MYGIGFLVLGAGFVAIMGAATMYLWNWLVPTLFSGTVITFMQAIGLLLLAKLLFGFAGFGRRGWGHRHSYGRHYAWKRRMTEKMRHMSPEQREKFKQYYYNRCGFKVDINEHADGEQTAQAGA